MPEISIRSMGFLLMPQSPITLVPQLKTINRPKVATSISTSLQLPPTAYRLFLRFATDGAKNSPASSIMGCTVARGRKVKID